ncbi:NlpC/P60 family protein [Nitriliruptoraceae bacterium ZYF776]|nr:NlpC/P60 family protein [Profundirhabdus halotolerans]
MVAVAAGTTAAPVALAPGEATGLFGAAPGAGVAPGVPSAGGGDGSAVIQAGERYLGVPYRWGGTDPSSGLDCSGFVQRVFDDLGVKLPRVSVDQARQGTPVASLAEARPGDLVFWRGDGRRPNHIGIYAGDGRMLVAPRTGDVVRYQDITRTPHGIRRVV